MTTKKGLWRVCLASSVGIPLLLSQTESDPVAGYWKQYDASGHSGSDSDVAANLRARGAAARAKIASEAAKRHGEMPP